MDKRTPRLFGISNGKAYLEGSSEFVVAGSLQKFSNGLSAQRRLDVLHSTLYAQVIADSKYSRSDIDNWYMEYVQTLRGLGWQMNTFNFEQHTPSGIFFKFSTILEKCGEYNDLLQSFQTLGVSSPKTQLLHQYSLDLDGKSINFQLLRHKAEDEQGLTVSFAACHALMSKSWMDRIVTLNSTLTSYMFANMPTLLMKLFCGVQDGTLDVNAYVAHRDRVIKELTDTRLLTKLILSL